MGLAVGGLAHCADDLTGGDPVALPDGHLRVQIAVDRHDPVSMIQGHRGTQQQIILDREDLSRHGSVDLVTQVGGEIDAVVSAPVAHGGVIGQLRVREGSHGLSFHRGGKGGSLLNGCFRRRLLCLLRLGRFCCLCRFHRLSGDLLRRLFRSSLFLLSGPGDLLCLPHGVRHFLCGLRGQTGRGLHLHLSGSGDGLIGGGKSHVCQMVEIVAGPADGHNTQQKHHVKAFAQQEITDAAEKRFLLHGKKHLQSQVWTASEVFIHSVA